MGLSWPLVVERGAVPRDAIPVGSWPQELVFVHSQRCPCGGRFREVDHQLVTPTLERWRARCQGCERLRPFWFDVGGFEGLPDRFDEVRQLFSDALERVDASDLDGARVRFAEVVAREPWFGLGWYHLGMIAMVQDEADSARRFLETAAGILPMDPEVRGSLADFWEQQDEPERATQCRETEQALRGWIG